ncbi:MAG: isocitrate dehydrogenase kinase/phosphatase-domain containing protein [Thermoanaerobaculia bacterium]
MSASGPPPGALASDSRAAIGRGSAPGEPGLVMSVFTLPSFEFVFKVIKDTFPSSKATTRDEIRGKYRQVLLHDRVGRLVDYQVFEHVRFPRKRFSKSILEELLAAAANTVELIGDDVVIHHMYVGRRVTPLDIFLPGTSADHAKAAVLDWGQTLKDLAAADIFTGDILLKNFGVTRHGRVVFYDYDEVSRVSTRNFRPLPQPRNEFEELSAEPWYPVADEDVFPEELNFFLGFSGAPARSSSSRRTPTDSSCDRPNENGAPPSSSAAPAERRQPYTSTATGAPACRSAL